MKKYRLINFLPFEIESRIDPQYTGYRLLEDKGTGILDEPQKNPLPNNFKFTDPNEYNKAIGLPPAYVVVKVGEKVTDWIVKNFKKVKILRDCPSDIIFEGEWGGY